MPPPYFLWLVAFFISCKVVFSGVILPIIKTNSQHWRALNSLITCLGWKEWNPYCCIMITILTNVFQHCCTVHSVIWTVKQTLTDNWNFFSIDWKAITSHLTYCLSLTYGYFHLSGITFSLAIRSQDTVHPAFTKKFKVVSSTKILSPVTPLNLLHFLEQNWSNLCHRAELNMFTVHAINSGFLKALSALLCLVLQ